MIAIRPATGGDVAAIDARAKSLGVSRSQYLVQIARADLEARAPLMLREQPSGTY